MNSKLLSQERFGQFAKGYVESKTHARGKELDRLVEIAEPQKKWTVLDIATGGGHTALRFSSEVTQVYATDITLKMLETATVFVRDNGGQNVLFKQADAEDLPFENGRFDLVTCRIAPHHFSDCPAFVKEAYRVLKPDALLIVQDHVLPDNRTAAKVIDCFEKVRDPSHNKAYSQSEWMTMFESTGFGVEHIETILKTHEFLPWANRQGCTPEVIETLNAMLEEADDTVIEWMQPDQWRFDTATFTNHHIIIAGRKLEDTMKSTG